MTAEIRCPKCGMLLCMEQYGRVEVKRTGFELRIYGGTLLSVTCSRCNTATEKALNGHATSGEHA